MRRNRPSTTTTTITPATGLLPYTVLLVLNCSQTIILGCTPCIMSGLPALPIPTIDRTLDTNIGLDDSQDGVHDQAVGDDRVERLIGAHAGRLSHALANRLAAAEFALVAVDRSAKVALDAHVQRGVAEAHRVARGGTVQIRVGGAVDDACPDPA